MSRLADGLDEPVRQEVPIDCRRIGDEPGTRLEPARIHAGLDVDGLHAALLGHRPVAFVVTGQHVDTFLSLGLQASHDLPDALLGARGRVAVDEARQCRDLRPVELEHLVDDRLVKAIQRAGRSDGSQEDLVRKPLLEQVIDRSPDLGHAVAVDGGDRGKRHPLALLILCMKGYKQSEAVSKVNMNG